MNKIRPVFNKKRFLKRKQERLFEQLIKDRVYSKMLSEDNVTRELRTKRKGVITYILMDDGTEYTENMASELISLSMIDDMSKNVSIRNGLRKRGAIDDNDAITNKGLQHALELSQMGVLASHVIFAQYVELMRFVKDERRNEK